MAIYQVTEHPGFPSPSGFIRPGGRVTLPDDAIPSRGFIPLDAAAHAALTKAKIAYVEDRERRMAELDPPKKLSPKQRKDMLAVPEIPKAPAPKKNAQPEEIEAEEDGQHTIRELAQETGFLEKPVGGKRAADSK